MHISERPTSKRTAVTEQQARMLATLIHDMEGILEGRPSLELSVFRSLPEYRRLEMGGYACGFVCRDLKIHPRYEEIMGEPRRFLEGCAFGELRQFIHSLWRAEHWADGYGSPIKEAVENGALGLIATRLSSDNSLRAPDEELG